MKNPLCKTEMPRFLIALGIAMSLPFSAAAGPPSRDDPKPSFVHHELIVLLASGPGVPTPEEVVERAGRGLRLTADLAIGGPTQVRFVLPEQDRRRAAAAAEDDPDNPAAILRHYLVFTYPMVVNLEAVQAALERNPQVLYVGENRRISVSAVIPMDELFRSPSDPPDQHQWGSYLLSLPDAWERTKGHAWVGVIDLGIDTDHPDLRAFHTSGSSAVYDEGNFRPHLSYDYGYGDDNVDEGQPQVENGALRSVGRAGHGTHVAGIVGATANNGFGVAGVCWGCSLIISKISHLQYYGSIQAWINDDVDEDDWVAGIYGAVDRGAQVLNMSLGLRPRQNPPDCASQPLAPLCMALDHAQQRDVVIVAAVGNDHSNQIDFPAKDPRVLAAGGLAPGGGFWNGSNYDPNQLNTPAQQVLSTFVVGLPYSPSNGCDASLLPGYPGYGPCTGTSMASPYLAGSSGLLRSINPLLSKDDIKNVLLASLENPLDWDPQNGKGKPNIATAADKALGNVNNVVLTNRLTPLFNMYSYAAEDYFYTTVPQMGAAANWDAGYGSDSPDGISWPDVPGYGEFPGLECQVGPCVPQPATASVYVFTTDRSPNGPPLSPLYRMTKNAALPGNPYNRDTNYATEPTEIVAFKGQGYELDGIEGYVYKRCTPEPSCIPAGAVRLYRRYNATRDDYAIFPQSELAQMEAAGYSSTSSSDWIGYVYPNVDSDSDNVIDGFETLLGTNPQRADNDCDGVSDGTEVLNYPYGDPGGADHLNLSNQTIATTHLFSACRTITAGTNFVIAPGGDVTLHAVESITLRPGFKVSVGGQLKVVVP